jgi:hypothetical protein
MDKRIAVPENENISQYPPWAVPNLFLRKQFLFCP